MRDDHRRAVGLWTRLKAVARRVLSHRRFPLVAAALGVVLVLPSLNVGRVTEDFLHGIQLLGNNRFEDTFGPSTVMFEFYDGDPARTHRMMDLGVVPWWGATEMKERFWRPVTVLTHRLDYLLWPTHPWLMHAQSILWYGALVAAAAFLYRRMMGPTVAAGVAALLFAVDDAHGIPVGFLANRNAVVAAVFGVCALIVHERWRRHGWRAGVVVGPLLVAVSLLSAEAGIATLAYLAAYELFIDRGSWRGRAAALAPYVAVVLVWRLAWRLMGYGVGGVGLYVDPLSEPLRFAAALTHRVPLLLQGQWGWPPSDATLMLAAGGTYRLWLVSLGFLALLSVLLWPLLRRDRLARFWALGMLLSLLPACATFPNDRMLLFTGIGAMGLLARFFAFVVGKGQTRSHHIAWRSIAKVAVPCFLIVHFVVPPACLPFRSGFPMGPPLFFGQPTFPEVSGPAAEKQDVIIVNPPSAFHVVYLPLLREMRGQSVPRHTRVLASGMTALDITRRDDRTLVIRPRTGFLGWQLDHLFRDPGDLMPLGEQVQLAGMTVEITELTDDGRPAEAVFRFDVLLEDPSLKWFAWVEGDYVSFTPPPVGGSVALVPNHASPLTTVIMCHLKWGSRFVR